MLMCWEWSQGESGNLKIRYPTSGTALTLPGHSQLLCPGQTADRLAMRAETLLGLFGSAQHVNVKMAPRERVLTVPLVADIPAGAFPGQSDDRPNGRGRPDSAPKDPAGRVGAGSCMRIGDLVAVGASRTSGPG